VSSVTGSSSSTSGRRIAAIVLAIVAAAFIIAGLIYAIEPAKSLPSFMGHKNSAGHHALRMAGSFIVGLVFAAGAWVALAYKPKAQDAPQNNDVENTTAGRN
jgi:amino acid permease